MPQPAATTLRGALLVLGQDYPEWLKNVDGQLGNVLTGTSPQKSMHGVFGWLLPDSTIPELVRWGRHRALDKQSLLQRGQDRRDLVAALHTATVALSFFGHVRKVLAAVPDLTTPTASGWYQEDHSFVS